MRFINFMRCFMVTLLMLTGTFSMTAFAASTVGEWQSDECTVTLTDDGTLTVRPTSVSSYLSSTERYTSDSPAPWQAHAGDIRHVVIGDSVELSGIFLKGSTIDSITFEGSFLCDDYRGAPFQECTFTTDIDVSCFAQTGTGDGTHLFDKCVFNGTLSCNLNDTHPTNFLTIAEECTINGDLVLNLHRSRLDAQAFPKSTITGDVLINTVSDRLGIGGFQRAVIGGSVRISGDNVEQLYGYEYNREGVFYDAEIGGDVIFPDSVKIIGDSSYDHDLKYKMFYGAKMSGKVHLPKSLEQIYNYQLDLRHVELEWPSTVKSIGRYCYISDCRITNETTICNPSAFSACTFEKPVVLLSSSDKSKGNTFKDNVTMKGSVILYNCTVEKKMTIDTSIAKLSKKGFEGCTVAELSVEGDITEIPESAFENATINKINLPNTITTLNSKSFKNAKLPSDFKIGKSVSYLGSECLYGCSNAFIEDGRMDLSGVTYIGADAFGHGLTLDELTLPETTSIDGGFLKGCNIGTLYVNRDFSTGMFDARSVVDNMIIGEKVKSVSNTGAAAKIGLIEVLGNAKVTYNGLDTEIIRANGVLDGSFKSSNARLKEIWVIGGEIHNSVDVNNVPSGAMFYVPKGSQAETFLTNAKRAFKYITEDNLYGKRPSLKKDDFMFNADSPRDLKFRVDLGKKPDGASSVKSVTVDNIVIETSNWTFNGKDSITVNSAFVKTLSNGTHTIGVEFDNGVYSAGATVTVINSTVGGNGGSVEPPEALDTIKYEFYKDYPDYVIIPVKLNGASAITQLKVGTDIVDPVYYKLQDGAIILDKEYLLTLEPAKYRVLPTFNDASQTTITNLQLIVYEKAADRAAPYLLQSRVVFDGSDVVLIFDPGKGDLETTNVLALVIDNDIVLPNGDILPLSKSNLNLIKDAFEASLDLDKPYEDESLDDVQTPSNARPATPSNAVYATPSEAMYISEDANRMGKKEKKIYQISTILADLYNGADTVFIIDDCNITLSGDYVSSMNLSEGNHLIGAIFDNTERTTDLKKVILTVSGEDNKPVDPEDPNKPVDPENPGEDGNEDNKPVDPENPNKPVDPEKPEEGGGSGNGGGGSSSGGSENTKGPGTSNNSKLPDGSINPDFKPIIPDDGGHFEGGGDDWIYIKPDGSHAKDEWVSSGGDWYYIDENGKMKFDWFLDRRTNKWYLLNKDHNGKFGAVKTGWVYEKQDGKWYFLNPTDGSTLLGWQFIGGKWYYLTPSNTAPTYFGDNIDGWFYKPSTGVRPLGSMYINETTPDGYVVDITGAWIK